MEAHAKAGLTKTYYGEHFTHGFHTQNYQKSQAPLDTHPENTRGIHRITQPNPYPWIFSDTNPTKPIHKKSVWVKILPLGTQISGTQSSPYYSPLDPIFKILYNIRYSSITVALKLTAGCLVCTCKIKSCDQGLKQQLCSNRAVLSGFVRPGVATVPLVCTYKIKSCDQNLKHRLYSGHTINGFVGPGLATVPLIQVTERKILLFVYLIDYLSTIILESYKSRNFLTNSMQKP